MQYVQLSCGTLRRAGPPRRGFARTGKDAAVLGVPPPAVLAGAKCTSTAD